MRRLLFAIGLIALLLLLHNAFPGVLRDEDTRMRAIYLSLLIMLGFAGGSRAFKNRPVPRVLRDGAIWLTLILVLVVAHSFRDELGNNRLLSELIPTRVRVSSDGVMTIRASDGGHFFVDGEVNGTPTRFLIDTGATDVVLTPEDAGHAGMEADKLDYSHYFTSANGGGNSAAVTLGALKVGPILMQQMPASVNKAWMHESLLGMSFLRRLKGFHVDGDTMTLIP